MYIFWAGLGGIAILLYITLDVAVTLYIIKQTRNEEKVILPGKKNYYVAASTLLGFTIVSAFYFAGVNYVGAPYQFICWPVLPVVLSLPAGWTMSIRLGRASFE